MAPRPLTVLAPSPHSAQDAEGEHVPSRCARRLGDARAMGRCGARRRLDLGRAVVARSPTTASTSVPSARMAARSITPPPEAFVRERRPTSRADRIVVHGDHLEPALGPRPKPREPRPRGARSSAAAACSRPTSRPRPRRHTFEVALAIARLPETRTRRGSRVVVATGDGWNSHAVLLVPSRRVRAREEGETRERCPTQATRMAPRPRPVRRRGAATGRGAVSPAPVLPGRDRGAISRDVGGRRRHDARGQGTLEDDQAGLLRRGASPACARGRRTPRRRSHP